MMIHMMTMIMMIAMIVSFFLGELKNYDVDEKAINVISKNKLPLVW